MPLSQPPYLTSGEKLCFFSLPAQLRSQFCFPDRLVILNKDGQEYFETIRKRHLAEVLENFLSAGHLASCNIITLNYMT